MARSLNVDPLTGLETQIIAEDGDLRITQSEDVEPVLKGIKQAKDAMSSNLRKVPFRWVGSIPSTLITKWAAESNTRPFSKEWTAYAKQKLNSNEYRDLRVWEGNL